MSSNSANVEKTLEDLISQKYTGTTASQAKCWASALQKTLKICDTSQAVLTSIVLGVKTDGTGTSAADAVEQITSELAKCTKDATESCLDVPKKTQECLEQQDEEDGEESDDEDDDNGNELAEELEKSTKTITALTAKVETLEADLATRTTELQTSQTTVATLTDDQTGVLTTVRSELDEVKRQLKFKSSELVEALRKEAISESKSANTTWYVFSGSILELRAQ